MTAEPQSSDCPELLRQWEQAYLARSCDAATGRLFRGIVHNLNGVLQVASFQGEMSGLALERAADLLDRARETAAGQAAEPLNELANLLAEQQQGLVQFKERIGQGSEIMRRALVLPALSPRERGDRFWNLNDIVRCEIEFLSADSFFKHKVGRKLEMAPELPVLSGDSVPVHEVVHILLENALDAVRDCDDATLEIVTRAEKDHLELVVRDNGPGVAAADRERIFAPFFTTRPQRAGLGLYLARQLVAPLGGEVHCLEGPGGAFQLRLPLTTAGE